MANRNYSPPAGCMEKEVVTLFAKVTFGAAGSPTLTRGKGIRSVSRSGAGVFVFTFGTATPAATDKYVALLGVPQPTFIKASAPSAPLLEVTTDSATNGSVTVTLRADAAGAATDPASGEVGIFQFHLSNSGAL